MHNVPLAGLTGFENSLIFDENGSTSTKAVYIARDNNRIIGAGALTGIFLPCFL